MRQSTWTPIERGVIAKVRLPATNVTGTVASAAERRSSSFWAAFGLIPPTSMPAILVPSASRSAEPAKKRGTPTASSPAASPRIAILVQKRERTTERPRTAEEEAATARAMVAADAD